MSEVFQGVAPSRPVVVRAADLDRKYPYLQVIRIVYMVIAGGFLSLGLMFLVGGIVAVVRGGFGDIVMPLFMGLTIAFTGVCAAAMGELIKLAIDIQSDTRAIARRK